MMRKLSISTLLVCLLVAFSSCRSSQEAVSLSSMNGEWRIIEINGSAVVVEEGRTLPFMGFDSETGKVYGYVGCNRISGQLDTEAKAGEIDLSGLATTRMMCHDMTLEDNLLGAFAQVEKYKKMGKNTVALCNASNRPVVVMEKKEAQVSIKSLKGAWNIIEVAGEAVAADLENQPFMEFDINGRKVHGNAGCNLMNGSFLLQEDNALAISFPDLATTMMACPNMEVENSILAALRDVKSFDQLAGNGIGLYDANGNLVIVLTKK